MFLFILQDVEPIFDELTLFLFVGLAIMWFFFNRYRERFSKKILWILGCIIIIIGIFLSVFSIPNDSALFGVVVIFFGVIIMPLRDILEKIRSKTTKSNSNEFGENSDESYHNLSISKAGEYIHEGKLHKENNKYKKAIDLFIKALSVNPNSAEAWYELGEINLIRNRIPESLTCYKRAIDNKPTYTEAIDRFKEVKQKLDSENEQNQK